MPSIQLKQHSVYHETHGNGPALVLIAGFTCDHSFWTTLLPLLSRHFKVLIFDNPGTGHSTDFSNHYSLEDLASLTIELCDALDLKNPHVFGHSMGGRVAQLMAINHPDRIKKLVLCNTFCHINKRSLAAFDQLARLCEAGVEINTVIQSVLPWMYSEQFLEKPGILDSLMNYAKLRPATIGPKTFLRQLETLRAFNTRAQLPKITAPTLIISGADDVVAPAAGARVLEDNIKGALHINLADTGHAAPIEQPQLISDAVRKFLS